MRWLETVLSIKKFIFKAFKLNPYPTRWGPRGFPDSFFKYNLWVTLAIHLGREAKNLGREAKNLGLEAGNLGREARNLGRDIY